MPPVTMLSLTTSALVKILRHEKFLPHFEMFAEKESFAVVKKFCRGKKVLPRERKFCRDQNALPKEFRNFAGNKNII